MAKQSTHKPILEYQPSVQADKVLTRKRTIAGIFSVLATVVGAFTMVFAVRYALLGGLWNIVAACVIYSLFCFYTAYRWGKKAVRSD